MTKYQRLSLPNQLPSTMIFHNQFSKRKWFHLHGKSKHLGISDKLLSRLRLYFNALDQKKVQSIGSKQLQDPLIAFGLCEDIQEVQKLVKSILAFYNSVIDTDSSGVIQFDQFVEIFKFAQKKNFKTINNNKNTKYIKDQNKDKSGQDKFKKFASIFILIYKSSLEIWINKCKIGLEFKLLSANTEEKKFQTFQ